MTDGPDDGSAGARHALLLQRPLAAPLLRAIHEEARVREAGEGGDAGDASVSLPRLSKRLGVGASAVLRELTLLGDAAMGGFAGPGWVRVQQDEGRWRVSLTPAGRQCAGALREPPH